MQPLDLFGLLPMPPAPVSNPDDRHLGREHEAVPVEAPRRPAVGCRIVLTEEFARLIEQLKNCSICPLA
jgi:hypothetical protein